MQNRELAKKIDHTLLKPDATRDDIIQVCKEALEYDFASVCVNSANIPFVVEILQGSNVKPIAVVGFPLGATTSASKVFETKDAISAGAKEIDMVINIGALKSAENEVVYTDILKVVEAAKPYPVKVIIETALLSHDEKILACELAKAAGAAFVKTSTGFAKGGATIEDVMLMREVVGESIGVKASGGIRDRATAEAMLKAGANRLGVSASVAIVTDSTKADGGQY